MNRVKSFNFFGLKLSSFTEDDLVQEIKQSIDSGQKKILYGYSFGILPYFKFFPEIAIFSNQFDILVADGRGFYLLAKLLRYPIKSDISIPNMVNHSLDLANQNSYSVMLLGAKDVINKKATENIRKKFPGIQVKEGHHGYFKQDGEPEIVDFINKNKPDILLIGISSPMKERFAQKWKDDLDCKIIIPCGGVIDILADFTKPTPRFIKKIGLAWLYRFVQEPRRLFKDSIVYLSYVVLGMIPSLIFRTYILRKKDFSIPGFFHKGINAPLTGMDN
ncbi:MAG: WecB/TagA/CpsF family glycosyltransferase [Bacteroidetes bacterium]|nr:WecB/TagA/CpsF family glycosyltransferase [Bacteroidota bacterium]